MSCLHRSLLQPRLLLFSLEVRDVSLPPVAVKMELRGVREEHAGICVCSRARVLISISWISEDPGR